MVVTKRSRRANDRKKDFSTASVPFDFSAKTGTKSYFITLP